MKNKFIHIITIISLFGIYFIIFGMKSNLLITSISMTTFISIMLLVRNYVSKKKIN